MRPTRGGGRRAGAPGAAAATAAAALAALLATPANAQPSLLFGEADEAALRTRVASGVPGAAYDAMATSCAFDALDGSFGECAEELAFRYRMTGDAGYADAVVDVLLAAAAQDPQALYDSWAGNGYSMYAFAPIPAGMAVAYDMVRDHMSSSQRQTVVDELEQYGEILYGFTGNGVYEAYGNYPISAYAGLGLVALAIRGESAHPSLDDWLDACVSRLGDDAFRDTWNPGGSYDEGYGYSYYGSPLAIRFAVAYERATGVDLLDGANIVDAPAWFTYGFFPHGEHLSYADAHKLDGRCYASEYLLLVSRTGSEAGLWGWHEIHGDSGIDVVDNVFGFSKRLGIALWYPDSMAVPADPAAAGWPHHLWFPDTANGPESLIGFDEGTGGLGVFRAGWGSDSVAASLRVADEWAPHEHADSGSFTLAGYGAEFAVDPGYDISYTTDHNVVSVDWYVQGEAYRRSYYGVLESFFGGDMGGYARADLRYNLGPWSSSDYDDPSGYTPLQRADRDLVLMRGSRPYLVVVDDLRGDDDPHNYTWRMMTPMTSTGTGSGAGVPGDPLVLHQAAGPTLELTWIEPAAPAWSVQQTSNADGEAILELTATVSLAVETRFAAVLVPLRDEEEVGPAVAAVETTGGVGFTLDLQGATDTVLVRQADEGTVEGGGLAGDGRLLAVRHDGDLAGSLLVEATEVTLDGRLLFDSSGVAASASYAGTLLEVQGVEAAVVELLAWAPGTERLVLDGADVDFTLDADGYVHYPALPGDDDDDDDDDTTGDDDDDAHPPPDDGDGGGDGGCACRLAAEGDRGTAAPRAWWAAVLAVPWLARRRASGSRHR